jgi:hypothetical protein
MLCHTLRSVSEATFRCYAVFCVTVLSGLRLSCITSCTTISIFHSLQPIVSLQLYSCQLTHGPRCVSATLVGRLCPAAFCEL